MNQQQKNQPAAGTPDISAVIPAWNEAENLNELLPGLKQSFDRLGVTWEIIVVDPGSKDNSEQVCERFGAQFIRQRERGYGGALLAGFEAARGQYILTMDADGSHPPAVAEQLWEHRDPGRVLIASRYVRNGASDAEPLRKLLSVILNGVFSFVLRVPVRDMSTGFRIYPAAAVRIPLESRDFDVLEEILALQYARGYQMREIGFHYRSRRHGTSHARLIRFGIAYCRTLVRLRTALKRAAAARPGQEPRFLHTRSKA
jgi:dolichol-phosphate mannosyltransferase